MNTPVSAPYDTRPWLKSYSQGIPRDIEIPDVSLTQILDDTAKRFPRRRALAFFGRSLTYSQLLSEVDHFAGALRTLGVHKGDRISLVLPNCPQHVIAFYATLRLGAIAVPHDPLCTASELRRQLDDSGSRIVIVFDKAYEALLEAVEGETDIENIIVTSLSDYLPWMKNLTLQLPLDSTRRRREGLVSERPPGLEVLTFLDLLYDSRSRHRQTPIDPAEDLAVLLYSGSTAGHDVGAMLTHRNLVANAYQCALWSPPAGRRSYHVTLTVLPLFHTFGLTFGLNSTLAGGGTVVLVPHFDIDLVLAAVRRHKPSLFPGAPSMFQRLADDPRSRKAGVGAIRTCVSGATRLSRELVEAFHSGTGGRVTQGYGITETSPVVMVNPLDGNARHISVGTPLPNTEVRIVDENDPDRIVPVGYPGELLVRGPQVFTGYWNRPAETAETLYDGWVHTGDIMAMSPDGFFTLIDRKGDMIIVDSVNVYPSEVEEVLNRHRAVVDSAVVGIPDPVHGEAVIALVVLLQGQQLAEGELMEHCAKYLTPYKMPVRIEVRARLPRNALGKVLHRVLRDELTTATPSPTDPH